MPKPSAPQPAAPAPLEDLYGGDAQAYLAQVAAGNFGAPTPKAAPPPEEPAEEPKSGKKGYKPKFLEDDVATLTDSEGKTFKVKGKDNIEEAMRRGATFGTQHVNAREGMKEFNESAAGKALVASTGYLKGLTPFGLSDAAFHGMYGEGAMQGLEQAREDNAKLNFISQAAGMGAQMVLSAGSSGGLASGAKAAQAASETSGLGFLGAGALARTGVGQGLIRGGAALGAPMALLNKGAEAAGHLALKGMGGLGISAAEQLAGHGAAHGVEAAAHALPLWKEAAVRAVEKGVEGAVDGGIYNAISELGKDAFGDPEKAAEHFAHNLGTGALWGGVLGAGVGAASPYAREGINAALRKGTEAVDNTRGWLHDKLTNFAKKADEFEKTSELRTYEPGWGTEKKWGRNIEEIRAREQELGKLSIDSGANKLKGDERAMFLGGEKRQWGETLNGLRSHLDEATREVQGLDGKLVKEKVFKFGEEQFKQNVEDQVLADLRALGPAAQKEVKVVEKYLSGIGPESSLEQLQRHANFIKEKFPQNAIGAPTRTGTEAMQKVRSLLKQQMISDGEQAAQLLGENFATQYKTAASKYMGFKELETMASNVAGKAPNKPFLGLKDIGVGALFGGGDPRKAVLGLSAAYASKMLRDKLPGAIALGANKAAGLKILQDAIQRDHHGIAVAAAELVHGTAAHVAQHTAQHTAFHEILHAAEHGAEGHARDIEHQIEGIRHVADHPNVLQERVAELTHPIEQVAPEYASQTATHYVATFQSIAKDLPQPISGPTLLNPKAPTTYAQSDLDKFSRKLAVKMDPINAIKAALANNTLTQDHIDALKESKPNIYQAVGEATMNEIQKANEAGKPIPYDRRIRLESLLGLPGEPTTDPGFVKMMQASKGPPQEKKPEGAGPTGGVAKRKVKTESPEAFQTMAEHISGGRT